MFNKCMENLCKAVVLIITVVGFDYDFDSGIDIDLDMVVLFLTFMAKLARLLSYNSKVYNLKVIRELNHLA